MVKFVAVDPDDIDNVRYSRRGRVSYPILKSFLETGLYVAMLDRTGMQQSKQTLYSCLNAYARNHTMPIKIFSRSGQLYLMRLDIDEEGNSISNWQEELMGLTREEDEEIPVITPEEVAKRFDEEKDQVTK